MAFPTRALRTFGALVAVAVVASAPQAGTRNAEGTIVYGLHAPGRPDGFFSIAPDGSRPQRLPIATADCLPCLAISPDGTRLLHVALTADEITGATADVDGSNRRVFRLPRGTLNLGPTASYSDGKRLAFEGWSRWVPVMGRTREARWMRATYDASPRSAVRVATTCHWRTPPDEHRILILRTGPTGDVDRASDLYVVPSAGGRPVKLNPSGTSLGAPFGSPATGRPTATRSPSQRARVD